MAKIPHGEEHLDCPFWHKPMSEVCHKCPLWVQLRGKDPQSSQEFDEWGCTIMWLPKLLLENSQQMRQAGASTDKVATEVAEFHKKMVQMNILTLHQMEKSNGRGLLE